MKSILNALKSLAVRVPAVVRKDAGHVALVFAAAFVAAAQPALPSLLHVDGLSSLKAAITAIAAAGVYAGVRAALPLAALYLTKALTALTTKYGRRINIDIRITDLPEFQQAIADIQARLLADLEAKKPQ